jgi:hypothetical protein
MAGYRKGDISDPKSPKVKLRIFAENNKKFRHVGKSKGSYEP